MRLHLSRRGFLLGGAAAVAYRRARADDPTCGLTAEQEQGPYYIDAEMLRHDISENKAGVPIQLQIAILDAKRCSPLENAALDIWHCDAAGIYSGFAAASPGGPGGRRGPGDGRGPRGMPPPEFGGAGFGPGMPPPTGGRGGPGDAARFLRGVQLTDKQGLAEFTTLYPGWYPGRAVHIHLKVHLGGHSEDGKYSGGHVCHTGQLFFPEDVTEDVSQLDPYAAHRNVYRTPPTEDGIYTGQQGSASVVKLERLKTGSNAAGFLARITFAVDPEATPRTVGGRGRRG